MKSLSGGVKGLAAASLAGSLIFGGMTVTSVHVAGAKTNDTNQIENGKLRMENAGGRTTILRSPFSILHSASSVTDDDIARRWRVVSVSSNPVDASVFAIEQSNNQTIEQSPVVWEAGWFRERFDLVAERMKRGSMKYNTAEGDMSGLLLTRTRN